MREGRSAHMSGGGADRRERESQPGSAVNAAPKVRLHLMNLELIT